MTALNTELQQRLLKQGDTIADLSKQNIAAVTGGDSFCYLAPFPVLPAGNQRSVVQSGKYPLSDLTIWVYNERNPEASPKWVQRFPSMPPHGFTVVPEFVSFQGDRVDYLISFTGRNGFWQQYLMYRRVRDRWATATQVTRIQFADERKPKTSTKLYEYVDKEFPRDKKGEVDWNEYSHEKN